MASRIGKGRASGLFVYCARLVHDHRHEMELPPTLDARICITLSVVKEQPYANVTHAAHSGRGCRTGETWAEFSVELTKACLARIEQHNPVLNAFHYSDRRKCAERSRGSRNAKSRAALVAAAWHFRWG